MQSTVLIRSPHKTQLSLMDFYSSHFIDDKTEAIRKLRMCLPINRAFSSLCLPVNDKESACNVGDAGSMPRWGRSPEEEPTPVFLSRESPGQRSLAGFYSP